MSIAALFFLKKRESESDRGEIPTAGYDGNGALVVFATFKV